MLTREQFNTYLKSFEGSKKSGNELWKAYLKSCKGHICHMMVGSKGAFILMDGTGGIFVIGVTREIFKALIDTASVAETKYYETHHLEEVL